MRVKSLLVSLGVFTIFTRLLPAADLSGTVSYSGLRTGQVQVAAIQTRSGNKVLKLDGDGDFVRTPIRDLSGSEITIQYWFRGSLFQSAVRQQSSGWIVAGWNGLHILQNDGGTGGISAGNGVTDGNWHQLVMTWKQNAPGGFASYLDGKPVANRQSTDVPIPNYDAEVFFGAFNGQGEYSNGELDEIAIWRRALTAAEIQTNWNKSLTGNEPGLVGYWNFDDGTANDKSPNAYHGELNGDALVVEANIPGLNGGLGYATLAAPGDYSLNGLPTGPGYGVTAFLDANGNGAQDPDEPIGAYSGNPFELTANKSGVDIVLQELPYVTSQPLGRRKAAGDTVTFTVAVAGTQPFAYQWRKGEQDLADGGRISGAKTSQLTITGLTAQDSGQYYAVITNIVGRTTSDSAALAVVVGGKSIAGNLNYTGPMSGSMVTTVAQTRTNNKALILDGNGDYAITTLTDLSGDELTIEYWFKGSTYQSAVRQQSGGYLVAGWNGLHIISTDGGTSGIDAGKGADGNWHHLAMSWKRNTANGFASYLDGKLVTARKSSDNAIPNLNAQVYFGAFNGSGEFAKGSLDEIAIWNRALSQAEIQGNFRSGLKGNEAGLVGYWNFDDGLGQDLTANANHAELSGDATIEAVDNPGLGNQYVDQFAGPGPYRIESIAPGSGYSLSAFMDLNGNLRRDSGEPVGQFPGNPFDLNADKAGADITLLDPPKIGSLPSLVSAKPGETISLKVIATGTLPLAFQWFKGTTSLADGGRLSGATTDTFKITAADLTDEGSYSVVITNAADRVTGGPIAVTVTSGQIADRLVGHWKFDETSGMTAADASGKSGPGTLNNYADDTSPWVDGKIGKALQFGGLASLNYVVVEDYPKPTATMSVSAWAWAEARPTWASIIKNWADVVGQFHFGLQDTGGQLSNFITDGSGSSPNAHESDQFPLNSWEHVAFVADGARMRLYHNGVETVSAPYDGALIDPPMKVLGIGVKLNNDGTGPSGTPGFWQGKLDDIGLWTRALSPAEILAIYNAGLAGKDLSQAVIAPPEVRLTIGRLDSKIEITWSAGTLEAGPTVTGPWNSVPGATSPYITSPDGQARFFRVKQP